ncbi:cotranscriptional regulator ARB2A homolog isoform X1 [Crassostrea virginica]
MKVSAKLVGSFFILFTYIFFQGFYQFWRFVMAKTDDEEDIPDFPKTLEDFKYYFNEEGKLRHLETDEPFNFVVKPDNPKFNQKRYEALGNIITEHVYKLLEDRHLKKINIPVEADPDEPTCFFYMSEDALDKEKLLILIHGNGVVRAGQWARRLIINDCLDSGTQLPFIDWGIKEGYGVIVANTNYNTANDTKDGEEIRGSSSPEEHMKTVWQSFVQKSKASYIGIVAHSYGGVVTLDLAIDHIDEFRDRVFAVALTDSVHSFSHQYADDSVIDFYRQRGKNWASSLDVLDTDLDSHSDFCPTVSAGTEKHEYTSYSSMKSIFKFMSEKYQEMKEAAEGEETKTSVKESLEEKTDTEGTRSQEESEANDTEKINSVTKGKEEISMSKDILKADVSGEKSSTEKGKDVEVPMSQSEEDILDIEVSVTDNEGNEEIPMSQDFSSSQTDVDMNSQDPDGKQKEEL